MKFKMLNLQMIHIEISTGVINIIENSVESCGCSSNVKLPLPVGTKLVALKPQGSPIIENPLNTFDMTNKNKDNCILSLSIKILF